MRDCAQAAATQNVGAILLILESWAGGKAAARAAAAGTQAVGSRGQRSGGDSKNGEEAPNTRPSSGREKGELGLVWKRGWPTFPLGKGGSLQVPGHIQPLPLWQRWQQLRLGLV